jgi:hypothetical protein
MQSRSLALQDEDALRELVVALLPTLTRKSKPGVPWMKLGANNGEIIDDHSDYLVDAVVARIQLLSSTEPEVLRGLSAEELVRRGYCDPVRLFIKGEPHTTKKMKEGRYRLIANRSVADQLVERYFSSMQNSAEIMLWREIPSKPGVGFTDAMMADTIESVGRLKSPCATDIQGWDWSVQGHELDWEAEARLKLMSGENDEMRRLVRNTIFCLSLSVLVLSDGSMLAQQRSCIQKSGSYNTSSTNSRIRARLAWGRGAEANANGDDCVEEQLGESRAAVDKYYLELGHVVKDFVPFGEGYFEFCSHRYQDGVGVPTSWPKTLYRLIFARDEFEDRLAQFQMELRHLPDLERICTALSRHGWGRQNKQS